MGPNEHRVIEEHAIYKVYKKSLTGKFSHGTSHLFRHRKKYEAKHSGDVDPRQTTPIF